MVDNDTGHFKVNNLFLIIGRWDCQVEGGGGGIKEVRQHHLQSRAVSSYRNGQFQTDTVTKR